MSYTSVYIGNIPYEYSEEQVMDIAQSVGPVDDLKLLFNPVSGKSKGYAFVKYMDTETAGSAVRNLNNFTIGNRILKCSFANDNDAFGSVPETEKLPALPLGVQLFPNQTPSQAIAHILSNLDQQSATQLIREAQDMCNSNPSLMEKLLDKCPQLAHSLVEASLLLNLTKPETVEICVNRKKPTLERLDAQQINILKALKDLDEQELEKQDKEKRDILVKIRQEIASGSFGQI